MRKLMAAGLLALPLGLGCSHVGGECDCAPVPGDSNGYNPHVIYHATCPGGGCATCRVAPATVPVSTTRVVRADRPAPAGPERQVPALSNGEPHRTGRPASPAGLRAGPCPFPAGYTPRTGSVRAREPPMDAAFTRRGFLPEPDPPPASRRDSELAPLDELGRDLPSLLQDPGFRAFARGLRHPAAGRTAGDRRPLPVLRLYYIRLGFLASAYINQVGRSRRNDPAAEHRRAALRRLPAARPARRSSATTATPSTTGSGSTRPARSPWATSTRSRTSSTSTTSTGSSWCTSRSRPSPPRILAGDRPGRAAARAGRRGAAIDRGARPRSRDASGSRSRSCGGSRRRWTRALLQDVPALHPVLRGRRVRGGRCRPDGLPRRDRGPEQRHARRWWRS